MKRSWRRTAAAAVVATVLVLEPRPAAGEPPLDRLLIVAPAAPGGGWDQTARAMQQVLEAEGLVGAVEVQNVPGAAGAIGLAQFLDSQRGNGRALLVSGLVMVAATLWNNSPVAVTRATPIARLTGEYEVVAVPASSPHHTLRSLIDAFRARPEAVAWGGGSAGGTDHIVAGLIAEAARVSPRRVNYIAFSGGGEAVASLLGGNVTAGISGYSEFAPHIASGRLRALAISAPSRPPAIEVPTLRGQGLDVEVVNWRGVLAPPGLQAADRARLAQLVDALVHTRAWKDAVAERRWTDMYLPAAPFSSYLQSERGRLGRIVTRLRGPDNARPVGAEATWFAAAVGAGAAVAGAGLILTHRRSRRVTFRARREGILRISAGLALFVVLFEPLGFIVAASVLFTCAAAGFSEGTGGPQEPHAGAGTAPPARRSARSIGRSAAVALVFSTAVYLALTRGLDLALPAGSAWAWMR